MSHPLDDARDKLARAHEQFDALNKMITSYAESKPYDIVLEHEFGTDGPIVGRVKVNRRPLLARNDLRDWALLVGEVGDNMRNSLDYLVYQLSVLDRAGGVHPDDTGVRTQFPIFTSTKNYFSGKRYRDRLLAGVSNDHRTMIDSWQPFRRSPSAPGNDPLAVLDWLNNVDKHRLAHAVLIDNTGDTGYVLRVDSTNESAIPPGQDFQFQATPRGWTVNDGAIAFRFGYRLDKDVNLNLVLERYQLAFAPAFGVRKVTCDRLILIHQHVATILDQFVRAFGS